MLYDQEINKFQYQYLHFFVVGQPGTPGLPGSPSYQKPTVYPTPSYPGSPGNCVYKTLFNK